MFGMFEGQESMTQDDIMEIWDLGDNLAEAEQVTFCLSVLKYIPHINMMLMTSEKMSLYLSDILFGSKLGY